MVKDSIQGRAVATHRLIDDKQWRQKGGVELTAVGLSH